MFDAYRQFRAHNRFSHPLSMVCIDVVTLILKVLVLVGIGLLLYKVGNDWMEKKFRQTAEVAGLGVGIESYNEK